jgi:ubiquinone/menaquinone biosynthesis C-methylase UbiE
VSEPSQYIHGTAAAEQERLALLNRLTNAAFTDWLRVEPGQRVLDVGAGLGILAGAVARATTDVRLVGIERSPRQIAAALPAPRVQLVLGDAHALPVADGVFDVAYARYLLEHVSDPLGVLVEMRRVLRPGGLVAVCENDITLVRVDPPCPTFEHVWDAFGRFQARLGGDSQVGRRLFRLLRMSGFVTVELSVQPEVHWYGSPGFGPWVGNLIGNVESARAGLVEAGLVTVSTIDDAIRELRELTDHEYGSAQFVWNRARGRRGDEP